MQRMEQEGSAERTLGIWYAIAAYGSWGILPLYWKALKDVPALEILAHRMVWSCIFVVGLIFFTKGWQDIREAVASKRTRLLVSLCAALISINWFIYIWAVNADRIVEANMGYYMNPLASVLLAVVVLKENLNFWQKLAIGSATVGVSIMTFSYGKFPWVAISLAISFALYGLFKKMVNLKAMTSLALETMIVSPLALLFLSNKGLQGTGAFGTISLHITLLLMCAGIVTALPLLWFAQATRRIPLSTLGFIQYFTPTCTLLLGVFLYKEPFTHAHLLSFGFIWSAILIYSLNGVGWLKTPQTVTPKGARG